MPVKPFTPKDAVNAFVKSIPDEVIQSFNELIAKNFDGSESHIFVDDVMKRIMQNLKKAGKTYTEQEVYNNHWLDVEPLFTKSGWNVKYDQPAYCENYKAFYVFKKKKLGTNWI